MTENRKNGLRSSSLQDMRQNPDSRSTSGSQSARPAGKRVKGPETSYSQKRKTSGNSTKEKGPANRRRIFSENGFAGKAVAFLDNKGGNLDIFTFVIVSVLMVFGLLMVCSVLSATQEKDSMVNQVVYLVIGFVTMIVLSRVDYQIFNSQLAIIIYAVAVIWNGYYGVKATISNSISRGGSFQPSEILKFAVIIMVSYLVCAWLYPLKGDIRDKKVIWPTLLKTQGKFERWNLLLGNSALKANIWLLAVIALAAVTVFLQSHLSGAILIGIIGFSLMWAGGGNKKLLGVLLAVALIFIVIVIIYPDFMKNIPKLREYMYERVVLWKEKAVPENETFSSDRVQIEASLEAIASGGWFGNHYSESIMKFSYLPEAKTDFIFAIVIDELGYVGGLVVIALFACLVGRLLKIARNTKDKFGALIVIGVACHIAIQVILNIAVVTDSMPNTGITLPFFSYGRSALVMLCVEMGVVLSVSRASQTARKSGEILIEEDNDEDNIDTEE